MKPARRIRRCAALLCSTLFACLALAPSALAADGIGLWGPTDDKAVTLWGLALVVFFPLLALVLTLIQSRFEARKDRRKRELARFYRD